jgi:hypothetical protein
MEITQKSEFYQSFMRTFLLSFFLLWSSSGSKDTHIVKKGDTLWDISDHYLQDPFKWPDIWHFNPEIKNPHLIYPGDEIKLGPALSDREDVEELDFGQKTDGLVEKLSEEVRTQDKPSVLTKGIRYLLPQIIERAPFLTIPVKRRQIFENEGRIQFRHGSGETLLQPYSKITINLGKKDGIKAGDLYQIYDFGKKYSGFKKKKGLGTLVCIKGIVKISKVRTEDSEGILVECFDAISKKARVSPWKKAKIPGILGYRKYPDTKINGQIVYLQDNQNAVLPYSYVIIDQGGSAGFKVGDGVVLFNRDPVKKQADDTVLGKGIVVRINDFSTSILVKEIFPGKLNKGDFAIALHSAEVREG